MSTPTWRREFKKLSGQPITEEDFYNLWAEVLNEKNDRAAALIAATIVENVLRGAIESHVVPLIESEKEGLFGTGGPLSTFSNLIRIGYVFGLYEIRVKRDLDRMREIRNIFAHAFAPIGFGTPAIETACMGFEPDSRSFHDLPGGIHPAKRKYLTAMARLVITLAHVSLSTRREHTPVKYDD